MGNSNCTFSFKFETQEKSCKLIQNLNSNKAAQYQDIPIKMLKGNRFAHIYYTTFSIIFYLIMFSRDSLRKVYITPVFKKDKSFEK